MNSKPLRLASPAAGSVFASALALLLAAGAGYAQAPAAPGEAAAEAPRRAAPFMMLDTDKDGQITRAEWDAPRLNALKAMDPDQDGVITLEEMKAAAVERATKRAEAQAERRFKMLDLDGDGKVTAAEALLGAERAAAGVRPAEGHGAVPSHHHGHGFGPGPRGPRPDGDHKAGHEARHGGFGPGGDRAALFDRIDADKNGVLSAEELENAGKALRGPKGGKGPRGEGHMKGHGAPGEAGKPASE